MGIWQDVELVAPVYIAGVSVKLHNQLGGIFDHFLKN